MQILAPDTIIIPVSAAKTLGYTFDASRSFEAHIILLQLSRTCYARIRDLRHLRPFLDIETASTIMSLMLLLPTLYCYKAFCIILLYQVIRLAMLLGV